MLDTASKLMQLGSSPDSRADRLRAVFEVVDGALKSSKLDFRVLSGYSREHVNRLLNATLGEPLKPLTLRIRLERAAWHLQASNLSISSVAELAGYADSDAFIKAFSRRYGIPPGRFRYLDSDWKLSAPSDLHWDPSKDATVPICAFASLQKRDSVLVAVKRVIGDYRDVPRKWDRLCSQLPGQMLDLQAVSVFHDDGMRTHGRERMRADLGFVVSAGVQPQGFEVLEVPGGTYVATSATCSNSEHSRFWSTLNEALVSKRSDKNRIQPGYDLYGESPKEWKDVRARIFLAI